MSIFYFGAVSGIYATRLLYNYIFTGNDIDESKKKLNEEIVTFDKSKLQNANQRVMMNELQNFQKNRLKQVITVDRPKYIPANPDIYNGLRTKFKGLHCEE